MFKNVFLIGILISFLGGCDLVSIASFMIQALSFIKKITRHLQNPLLSLPRVFLLFGLPMDFFLSFPA